jgi:release factor glutamine methyltransferase
MPDLWTIQRLLTWTRDWLTQKGSPSARLDAELLLGEVLKLRRLDLLLRFDQPVEPAELTHFKALIQRRSRGEPVAYILGHKGFHGIDVHVTPAVLVPRPETERVVDVLLAFLRGPDAPQGPVLDLCTGSGAIALAVAFALSEPVPVLRNRSQVDDTAEVPAPAPPMPRPLVATDVSAPALDVARANATRLGLPLDLRHGDLWDALQPGEAFAAIASNPPYVLHERLATLDVDVREFEPHLALDGGPDGNVVLDRIAAQAKDHLLPGGLLAVELGSREQGLTFAQRLDAAGLVDARVEPIQGGPTSLVTVRRPA